MPHKRARTEGCLHAREAAHDVRRLPLVLADHSPEAALLSLETLRGILLLLPRDWLKQALLRLRSIVRELSVLVEPQYVGVSSDAASSSEPVFDPV